MNQALFDLIEISRFAARHPDWTQGGGGNCSVKTGGHMWIKASGYFMEEVSETGGYAVVDLKSGAVVSPPQARPSLESPLHSLLGSFVIHTHPVAVAALVSSVEGPGFFKELFPESFFLWVDYAAPGQPLYEKVKISLASQKAGSLGLFLQNHGLFVSAPTKEEAVSLHLEIISRLENFWKPENGAAPIPSGCFLTPDHAVYGPREEGKVLSPKQLKAHEETLFLVGRALTLIQSKKWKVRWLNTEEADKINRMEEEKYRKSLWGAS